MTIGKKPYIYTQEHRLNGPCVEHRCGDPQ